jgi:hypothetical protein
VIERPHSSFARTATERKTRPLQIQRFNFGDLLQSHFKTRERTGREGNFIVPIEAVRPGDTQVLAAAEPRTNPRRPVIAIDGLARIPSVESVVSSTEVTLGTRLRSVTELLLLEGPPLPEPGAFAALPNLRGLHAMDVHRHGPKLSFQSIAGLDIRDLAVTWDTLEPGDVVNLGALSGLRRLVFWAGPANSVEAVGRLRDLEYLNLVGGRSGWARLAGLASLQEAVLWDARLPDLRPMSAWASLKSLWLRGRRVKSLDGISELRALESAWLEVLGIGDLTPLQGLERLTSLNLSGLALDDLGPLAGLPSLRRVSLSGAEGGWQVKSLAPLEHLEHLEEVKLYGVTTRDLNLSPLERLPRLKRLDLFPTEYLGDRVVAFRRARPDVTVTAPQDGGAASISIGPVEVHPPSAGLADWWFLQDLAGQLGTDTNTEAEARLQHAIGRRSPDLLARLRFDSEAGGVGVTAKSEADIREVADVIAELAESR